MPLLPRRFNLILAPNEVNKLCSRNYNNLFIYSVFPLRRLQFRGEKKFEIHNAKVL
jgi:hypothetical protein